MSFFDDDDEDEAPGPSTSQHPRASARSGATRVSARAPHRGGPPPRSARPGGPHPPDQHTLMMRRRAAVGVGVVLVIVIALIVNGCLKSGKESALKSYNQHVVQLLHESDEQVSHPLFTALSGAAGKTPLQVQQEIDGLRSAAEGQAASAAGLSVPSEMTSAQRYLLLTLDLRKEGVSKIAGLVSTALGGQNKQAFTQIAGEMENFLASDVVYSQRVAPLIKQELAGAGISEEPPGASNFLPNLGWLSSTTVQSRMTGQSSGSSSSAAVAPGTHGSALLGATVGSTTLQPAPAVNRVSGGANPSFTVNAENSGSNNETNVKVEVTVVNGSGTHKGTSVVPKTEAGKPFSANVTVEGVALNVASHVTAYVVPVPGETNIENNKQTYDVVFE